jgi:thiopeptide-type bacteriocin biosynthesis protein
MNDVPPWHQVNVTFPDWDRAEHVAAARVGPHLDADGTAGNWWFIRKHPCWRIRYQPSGPEAGSRVEQHLDELAAEGHITGWTRVVYEPEVHAFGGPEAMAAAHRLFHADCHGILTYLRRQPGGTHRREISLMLCSVMMRAAQLDLFEQGDVWARVASYRQPPPGSSPNVPGLVEKARHLLTADAESRMRDGAPLAHCAGWAATYATAGQSLAGLNAAGHLHRGLRDVLAHHVIFAWNRLGLPYLAQSVMAGAAKSAIFGPDPAAVQAG